MKATNFAKSWLPRPLFSVALVLWTIGISAPASAYTRDLVPAVDLNPDPSIFEVDLVADEASVDVDGDGVLDNVFAFNGIVPGPLIEVDLGDVVIVNLTNELDASATTLHFHGIEGSNETDGSPVVQDVLANGESFTHRFRVTRPGTFWYHPHVQPSDQVFRGLFGALVVHDPAENVLEDAGVLPLVSKTVILSDTTVCDGTEEVGVCSESRCGPAGDQPCLAGDVPFVQPDFDCRGGGAGACRVALGTTIQVNGTPLGSEDELEIPNGGGVRLRLINAAIFRFFRLEMPGYDLYRIGGQGGLLDSVQVDGGLDEANFPQFESGEILLTPGDRADVVAVPRGSWGDVATIRAKNYDQIGPTDDMSEPGGDDVMRFRLVGRDTGEMTISEGDPLRTHPAVADPVEVLPDQGFDSLLDPGTEVAGSPPGSDSHRIELEASVYGSCTTDDQCHSGTCTLGQCLDDEKGPAIDGVRGLFDLAADDYTQVPYLGSSRFARVGDLLELSVANLTLNSHPFHLHGFHMQPIAYVDAYDSETVLHEWAESEFVDNIEIRPGQALVFRVRLDDRPRIDDTLTGGTGGAEGRWLFHCHIFHHAALGMISELVVLPGPVFEDGFESGDAGAWGASSR